MATLIITVNVVTPDREDVRAMNFAIVAANERRIQINVINSSYNNMNPLPAPQRPIFPMLLMSTGIERKNSYELVLAESLKQIHSQTLETAVNIQTADTTFNDMRIPFLEATPAKRAAALAALA